MTKNNVKEYAINLTRPELLTILTLTEAIISNLKPTEKEEIRPLYRKLLQVYLDECREDV